MPGTINANTVRKLGTQDGMASSELSGSVSTINANTIQMPAVQDGINIYGSGGRSTKARLDFGVHETQGRTASSGPVGKRSNTDVNPIHMPTTLNTSAGARSTSNASSFPIPNTDDKITSFDKICITYGFTFRKRALGSGIRRIGTSSNTFPMPRMNDRATSLGPGPGGKRSFTDAILMPLTQEKNTSAGTIGSKWNNTVDKWNNNVNWILLWLN